MSGQTARERGQAAVELVVVAPLLLIAALGLAMIVASLRAALAVEQAADRAVVAAAAGADAAQAARAGLPGGSVVRRVGGVLVISTPLPRPLAVLRLTHAEARVEVDG